MATCPNCGNETLEGAVFCDQCGTPIPASEPSVPEPPPAPAGGSVICSACGAGNVPGEAFCDFCGSPLEAPVPSADAVAELEAVSTEAELEVVPEAEEDAKPTCPACGAEVLADEAFCANCGATLAEAPIPPEAEEDVEAEAAVEEAEVEPAPAAPPVAEVEAAPVEAVPEVEPVPAAIVEEAEAIPEEPAVPTAPNTCPACGAEVEPGDKFCSNCGAAQAPAPAPAIEPAAPTAPPAPAPAAGPRLIVADSGAEIPLPAGAEFLIGREDPVSGIFPEVDLTPHGGEEGGVSRRHARLLLEDGSYSVEDLDSTNFSFVNKVKLAPGVRQPLNDGDELRCGRVVLILRIA